MAEKAERQKGGKGIKAEEAKEVKARYLIIENETLTLSRSHHKHKI
jgi:hypothetical protein